MVADSGAVGGFLSDLCRTVVPFLTYDAGREFLIFDTAVPGVDFIFRWEDIKLYIVARDGSAAMQ